MLSMSMMSHMCDSNNQMWQGDKCPQSITCVTLINGVY
jgi:hypothetical protein